jgi:signal transduction histidine kinase/ligand-binding sensor domain-containing protein/DNA-binding response OmpR family regulator
MLIFMKRFASLLLLTVVLINIYAQSGNYKFRRLDITNGLSNNQIRCICVDKKGFAWFGTINGLNRFDGNTFKIYKNSPADTLSLPFNSVYRICEDYKGCLWMWGADNVLTIYNPEDETFNNDHEVFHQNLPVSKNYISGMAVDRDSNMWISNNQLGVYHFSTKTKKITHLFNSQGNSQTIESNKITGISLDSRQNVWLVNNKGVLEKINPQSFKVTERVALSNMPSGYDSQMLNLYIDKDDDIWIYAQNNDNGVFYYSSHTKRQLWLNAKTSPYKLTSNIITGVSQDENGLIWLSTDHGGINLLDKQTFSITVLQTEQGVSNSLGQNSITSMFKDRNGIMWIGTFKNGVSYYHPSLFQFKLFRNDPLIAGGLPSNDIDCFAEDASGNLWIGTNGNGLVYYNRQTNNFKTYQHNPSDPNSISNDIIVNLCMDSENRLWIGTYYGGLNMFDGLRFKRFLHNPADPKTIADNRIWHIHEDANHQIWIATLGGGMDMYDVRADRFTHYKSGDVNSIHSDFVLAIGEDKLGNLLIGTSGGLDILNPSTGRFTFYTNQPADKNRLSNSVVLSALQDKRGWIWVGTRNGLNCFDSRTKKFRHFFVEDGLPDNTIISIQEDGEGTLWMSTLNGISNLKVIEGSEPMNCKVRIRNFDLMDGLQGKEFNEHAGYKNRRGEILFGGPNGFNIFNPRTIKDTQFEPVVALTALRLQNRTLNINEEVDGRVILTKSINEIKELKLNHNQNVFSIEFSALHFLHPEKMKYKYKLDGFNSDWIVTDVTNRQATYTNLNPGNYVFRVVCTDVDGSWQEQETTLSIEVIPPYYATRWAFVFYFAILTVLIFTLIRIIVRREHLKFQRNQEKLEHQRMHELDNMKIRFFTNVSHEFRTPLTLILTPLDKLISKAGDSDTRNQLELIQRNGKRLLNLVNQLLDFRKMEVQNIQVNLAYNNIIDFIKETASSFTDLSESKNIDFIFQTSVNELFTWFDSDKIEKVIFNLLNNAFKFTPQNGRIAVNVSIIKSNVVGKDDVIEIKVSDSGIGIAKDKQESIFERFFQVESNGTLMNQGSGIGLSLTLEFVKLHKGTVTVESEPEKGSVFIIQLPLLTQDEAYEIDNNATTHHLHAQQNAAKAEVADGHESDKSENKPVVLIVEDNEDLRFYLKENLKHTYQILEAANGKQALDCIAQKQPTLIVSDIMMPEMDGLELCKQLKTDSNTSHIPIVLLTARTTHDQKIEGLEIGADEYITKPFSYELLELRIRKLIEQRKKLQQSLHLHYEIKPGEIGVTSLDEKFIQKALDIVEKNISNTDYSVERMSRDMGVSRGHLYNKIMALTGKTPIEFIRIMRLKRAAQLLGKSQLTVSEIAFEVGFNDPKYFSKYFKEEFNLSPSEYAKKVMKG